MFVELDRSFVPILKDSESELNVGSAFGRGFAGWLSWSGLLEHRRVVVLAEASSGKTAEFREQSATLQRNRRAAFFVPIEQLADAGLIASMYPTESDLFATWKAGVDPAWFFLDSVDEARLNRKSFDAALKRFVQDVGLAGLQRVHILLSCRVSDWRGNDDRRVIEELLPVSHEPTTDAALLTPDDALLNPILEKRIEQRRESTIGRNVPNQDPEVLVVRLAPLSEEQRLTLARGLGIADAGALAAVIDRQGLDAFAERPGDLIDLATYWRTHGSFGSRATMTAHAIDRKLRELDPYRPDNNVLSLTRALDGAKRIAAGLTLAKSFTLRAPDSDADQTLTAGALDPGEILTEWTDAERTALVRRGVFAPSTYGRLRFHHRSTQEYLTAEWLDDLLQSGCPREEVWGLLFTDRYGVKTIAPSLRPAAAWLALKHVDIRDEIIRREPLVLVNAGDPGTLPVETKRRLLCEFADKHRAGDIADEHLDHRALWQFADSALADTIDAVWRRNDTPQFHLCLLELIREGPITACINLARAVANSANANDYHRIVALEAMKACGDHEGLSGIASWLQSSASTASPTVAARFATLLFPRHLTVPLLLDVIGKTRGPDPDGDDEFARVIDELWDACPIDRRTELLDGMVRLCLKEPHVAEYQPISRQHRSLARHLCGIAREVVGSVGNDEPADVVIKVLMVVERAHCPDGSSNDDYAALVALLQNKPRIHRSLLWHDVSAIREARIDRRDLTSYWQIRFSGPPLWTPTAIDLPWLYEDLVERPNRHEKSIALSAIVGIANDEGNLSERAAELRALIVGDQVLEKDLGQYLTPQADDEARERRELTAEGDRKQGEKQRRTKEAWILFRDELRADPSRLSDPHELRTWAGVVRLLRLTQWLERHGEDREKRLALRWRLLEPAFGAQVAQAYYDGMKALWRLAAPERPARGEDGRVTMKWMTILSFDALALEATEDPVWATRLTEAEAVRAAGHGCMSGWGYPAWLDTLATVYPEVVRAAVGQAVRDEWASRGGSALHFLNHYATSAGAVSATIASELYYVIAEQDAAGLDALECGIHALQRAELDARSRTRLSRLASRRFAKYATAGQPDWALRYLAMLCVVDLRRAVERLDDWIRTVEGDERQELVEYVLGGLLGGHRPLIGEVLKNAPASALEALVVLAYRHVRPEEDRRHRGTYSPDRRDRAESARELLSTTLREMSGEDAYAAMWRISEHADLRTRARRFRSIAHGMAERDADMPVWTAREVVECEKQRVAPVKTGSDLMRVVLGVLDNICFEFEHADASSRSVLETATDEEAVQAWLAEALRIRSKNRFQVHCEVRVAEANRPDVVITSTSVSCEVAIEIKRSERWTVRELEHALTSQLAGRYLRTDTRRHGVLVITNHRSRSWRHPVTRERMKFAAVVEHLKAIAATVRTNHAGVVAVAVRGIDSAHKQSRNAS